MQGLCLEQKQTKKRANKSVNLQVNVHFYKSKLNFSSMHFHTGHGMRTTPLHHKRQEKPIFLMAKQKSAKVKKLCIVLFLWIIIIIIIVAIQLVS